MTDNFSENVTIKYPVTPGKAPSQGQETCSIQGKTPLAKLGCIGSYWTGVRLTVNDLQKWGQPRQNV